MIGEGIQSTNQRKHSYVHDHVEVGFFTDPTVCIGCKACEVACKEWNHVPDDRFRWSGNSYDNTGHRGASTWRHVMFLEQDRQKGNQIVGSTSNREDPFRWVFLSDVCKHCEEAEVSRSVSNRFDRSYRSGLSARSERCLQRLRILRCLVSIWCDRSATGAAPRRRRRV
jgi:ferredoxin